MYSTPVLSCLPWPQFILLALCPQKWVMAHITLKLPCLLDSGWVWSPGGTSGRFGGRERERGGAFLSNFLPASAWRLLW